MLLVFHCLARIAATPAEKRSDLGAHADTNLNYSDGEGFLVVYSITSRSTFERVERIVERVIRVKDDVSSPTYSSDPYGRSPQSPTTPGGPGARRRAPIVIVGNKRDLYNAREVSTEEARVLATRLGCDFYETSAKANTNVEAAFKSIVRQIKGTKRGYEGGGVAGAKVGGKKKKCVIL